MTRRREEDDEPEDTRTAGVETDAFELCRVCEWGAVDSFSDKKIKFV